MTINELEPIAKAEIFKWLDVAKAKYNRSFFFPCISFRLRGVVAGQWRRSNSTLYLNPTLMSANLESFKTNTIPHEVAHLVVSERYSNLPYFAKRPKPHGYEWQSTMRDLGVQEITRCHSYDTEESRVVKRPYVYKCRCSEHRVTPIIHKRVQKGQRRWCLKCKDTIVFARIELTQPLIFGGVV